MNRKKEIEVRGLVDKAIDAGILSRFFLGGITTLQKFNYEKSCLTPYIGLP